MNKIEKLINELCPNGIKYKKLSDVVKINRGKRVTKSSLNDTFQYEVYHGSKDLILGKYNMFNVPAGTVIVVNTGSIGGVKYIDEPFWCSDGSFWLGHDEQINNKFLYYILVRYEDYFKSKRRVGGVPTIERSVVEEIYIPLPPRAIQDEIVKILDNFTELTTELKYRKQQYEYYRDKLLTFDDSKVKVGYKTLKELCPNGVKIVKLSEVAKCKSGKRLTKSQLLDKGYPVMSGGINPIGYWKDYNYNENTTSIARYGTAGYVRWETQKFWAIDACWVITDLKDSVNARYLYYVIKNKEQELIESVFGTIPALKSDTVHNLDIPIPPRAIQDEIVKILDNFSDLTNDLTKGLPSEINLRQKQYEYYRDRLLNFREANSDN